MSSSLYRGVNIKNRDVQTMSRRLLRTIYVWVKMRLPRGSSSASALSLSHFEVIDENIVPESEVRKTIFHVVAIELKQNPPIRIF